jgi:DNA-binding NtrC family response regulator
MANKKIIIVDDEALIRQLIHDKLVKDGHSVSTFPNPLVALQAIDQENGAIDLIITDFKMPEMSGLDFVSIVSSKYPSIPIIVISGYGTNDDITRFLKNGAYDYLAKPFALKDLVQAIERVFSNTKKTNITEQLNQNEISTVFTKLEKNIFDTRPKVIRSLKILEELTDETTSLTQKERLKQAQEYIKEVSTTLIDITEYLKKISKT